MILLTNTYYYIAHMDEVYKWYKIAATEDKCALIMCHKITVTKIRSSSYGVVVTVLVSNEKAIKNNY